MTLLAKARRITCQVIVNACSSSPAWRRAIADALFPKRYRCLVLTDDVRVVGLLAYSLHTMVNVGGNEVGLGMPDLLQLIALMMQVEARYGDDESTDASLEILVTHLCFLGKSGDRGGRLEDVVRGLCFSDADREEDNGGEEDNNEASRSTVSLNSNHVYLFDALVAGASNEDSCVPDAAALAYLHQLLASLPPTLPLKSSSTDGNKDREDREDREENDAWSSQQQVRHAVQRSCLHLWRDAMACSGKDSPSTVATAQAFLPTLLDMLRRDEHVADVLSVIANACHRRPAVQASLLRGDSSASSHDVLCLILSHARGNPDAPLAREWALLAVRNLCECSQDARDAIQALEKVSETETEHTNDHTTYEVEYDERAGGWKLGVSSRIPHRSSES